MRLKLYYDFLSQPSRALYIFLKKCNIPFEPQFVNLWKLENFKPEFEKINPWKKIPCIEHKGFLLSESVGIFRYLCREFKVDDHWYPKDSQLQAKVDEYLEWQHLNTRLHCTTYFRVKYLLPLRTGKPAKADVARDLQASMIECLDHIEHIWLKDNKPFIANDSISIADILAACEIEQPRLADYDPREGRPNLTAWLDRVSKELSPHYNHAHAGVNEVSSKYK
ncbi:glutathione S-transferase theta-3 [Phymastichus coffea]|uniref:glutathione S-transferase theta-3 n=1 Tax=Phymastichus coffea TaxID=108790 RepID=UPI00273CB3DF|nr:glutathione S-transferase theta-3 [Phymastichus coffea]